MRNSRDDRSDSAHRILIGCVGVALPILLYVISAVRPTAHLPRWRFLDSISAYYYTGATAAFVGLLVALSLFLFTYGGYDNKFGWIDRWAGIIGGFAALGVAFFPTNPPLEELAASWWQPWNAVVHYVSAIVLFAMFAVFSLFLFRLTAAGERAVGDKRVRNHIYLGSGIVIVLSMIVAGLRGAQGESIFGAESAALVAFALSWITKGRGDEALAGLIRSK